jgi:hypothetical protein
MQHKDELVVIKLKKDIVIVLLIEEEHIKYVLRRIKSKKDVVMNSIDFSLHFILDGVINKNSNFHGVTLKETGEKSHTLWKMTKAEFVTFMCRDILDKIWWNLYCIDSEARRDEQMKWKIWYGEYTTNSPFGYYFKPIMIKAMAEEKLGEYVLNKIDKMLMERANGN